jgi:hypothetical protein
MQGDGRLVVGASDGEAAVVTRILADGQPDPSFLAGTDYTDRVGYIIHALAVGPDGSIVVALGLSDFGYHGLEIKQLLPTGELDESFGSSGSTEIKMPSEAGYAWLLFDILVREDGTIVGAGGAPHASPSKGPILVRLLGAGPGEVRCSQPNTSGPTPMASDCLFILRTAIGSSTCAPACICDTDGSGGTTASDALLCLNKAAGENVTLACPCDVATTTTQATTTSTILSTTTTLPVTTPIVSTTTTTIARGNIAD